MRGIHNRDQITDGVIQLLERGTAKRVGDHKAPYRFPEDTEDEFYPYCIVYSVPGGSLYGSLANQHEDAELTFQVTSVGLTRSQAEWMADRVRNTWCLQQVGGAYQVPFQDPTGWHICSRIVQNGFVGAVDREGDPPTEVWSIPERFSLYVTPVFEEA